MPSGLGFQEFAADGVSSLASLEGPFLEAVFLDAAFLVVLLGSSDVLINLFFNSSAKVLPIHGNCQNVTSKNYNKSDSAFSRVGNV